MKLDAFNTRWAVQKNARVWFNGEEQHLCIRCDDETGTITRYVGEGERGRPPRDRETLSGEVVIYIAPGNKVQEYVTPKKEKK